MSRPKIAEVEAVVRPQLLKLRVLILVGCLERVSAKQDLVKDEKS